jgi:3-phosphoshikimate 1-carboxyvinyltransferase
VVIWRFGYARSPRWKSACDHVARSPNHQIVKYISLIDYTLPLDQLPDPLPIEPLIRPFDVTITPPGSKSITNRAYVLAALAEGESRIIRPLRADDTDLLLKALCTLGAEAKWVEGQTGDGSEDVLIKGVGGRFPRGGHVNLGDGGTPTRFMIACACLAKEPVVVDGSKRMRERPIAEGVEMLRQLGAKIEYVEEEGRLPVRVTPSEEFKGGEITVGKTQSSQFVSALMLIGNYLPTGLTFHINELLTSSRYFWLTKAVVEEWHVEVDDWYRKDEDGFSMRIRIPAQQINAMEWVINADASSAGYWFLAAAMSPNARATVPLLGWGQPDVELFETLNIAGPSIITRRRMEELDRTVEGSHEWNGVGDIGCGGFPDGAVALAAGGATAKWRTSLHRLHTLRVKETDRIAALANELRKVGCEVETTEDSITITPIEVTRTARRDAGRPHARASADASFDPPAEPGAKPIIIETYNDHRMAMAFAVLGLRVPGIQIRNPACVKKSYPTFWKDFQKLYDNPRK